MCLVKGSMTKGSKQVDDGRAELRAGSVVRLMLAAMVVVVAENAVLRMARCTSRQHKHVGVTLHSLTCEPRTAFSGPD